MIVKDGGIVISLHCGRWNVGMSQKSAERRLGRFGTWQEQRNHQLKVAASVWDNHFTGSPASNHQSAAGPA